MSANPMFIDKKTNLNELEDWPCSFCLEHECLGLSCTAKLNPEQFITDWNEFTVEFFELSDSPKQEKNPERKEQVQINGNRVKVKNIEYKLVRTTKNSLVVQRKRKIFMIILGPNNVVKEIKRKYPK